MNLGGFTAQISYFGNTATNSITGGNDVVLYNFKPFPSHRLCCCSAGRRSALPLGFGTDGGVETIDCQRTLPAAVLTDSSCATSCLKLPAE